MNLSNNKKPMTTVRLTAVSLTVVMAVAVFVAFAAAVFAPHRVLFAQSQGVDLGDFDEETVDEAADEAVKKATAKAEAKKEAEKKAAEEKVKKDEDAQKAADEAAKKAAAKITTVPMLFARVADVLNAIVPFIIGLAILVIIWGILGYISHAGEEEKRQEAKQFIVWSIIALFIMLSIWGFVNVLVNSFALKNEIPLRTDMPSIPCIPIPPATTCS